MEGTLYVLTNVSSKTKRHLTWTIYYVHYSKHVNFQSKLGTTMWLDHKIEPKKGPFLGFMHLKAPIRCLK
jgi:hypothetical protein